LQNTQGRSFHKDKASSPADKHSRNVPLQYMSNMNPEDNRLETKIQLGSKSLDSKPAVFVEWGRKSLQYRAQDWLTPLSRKLFLVDTESGHWCLSDSNIPEDTTLVANIVRDNKIRHRKVAETRHCSNILANKELWSLYPDS